MVKGKKTVYAKQFSDAELTVEQKRGLSWELLVYLPTVGTVDKTSPRCIRYKIVVFPAESNPSITTYRKRKKEKKKTEFISVHTENQNRQISQGRPLIQDIEK
jgi:hypothetical protein